MNGIYVSIYPKHTNNIEKKLKNYEFRNYIPKKEIEYLIVYETVPTCAIKYIIKLGDIVKYPDKKKENGIGNKEFNTGEKNIKYAYEIKEIKKLLNPISLKELKEKYGFMPPQGYAYFDKYEELTKDIFNSKVINL